MERGKITAKLGWCKNTLRQDIDKIKNYLHFTKITYQLMFLKNKDLKVDHHTGGKWFIEGPKRHKENQLQSLEPAVYPKYSR